MDGAAGEEDTAALRVTFDPRLKLEFHGSKVTSDGGLLACRELDDALGLSETAGDILTDTRTGANGRPGWTVPPIRVRALGRLRGCERCGPAGARSGHALDRRWPGRDGTGGLHQPDGPLRDRGADPRGEPGGANRPERALDRRRACSPPRGSCWTWTP